MSDYFCIPDENGHCITCSDDAQQATVISLMADGMTALVEVNGAQSEVDISLVDEVVPGHVLLTHGGVALSILSTERSS